MGTLTADHAAFRSAVAELRAAAERLDHDHDRAARSVDGLLATWSGTVATAYASGWEEWRSGAARVLDGLRTMAALLEAADADLAATDVARAGDLRLLTARLG
jgi:WXG100 family type VII secretion target